MAHFALKISAVADCGLGQPLSTTTLSVIVRLHTAILT
jgi:hypothetical protein